jgi:hypothetical protein
MQYTRLNKYFVMPLGIANSKKQQNDHHKYRYLKLFRSWLRIRTRTGLSEMNDVFVADRTRSTTSRHVTDASTYDTGQIQPSPDGSNPLSFQSEKSRVFEPSSSLLAPCASCELQAANVFPLVSTSS